MNAREALEKLNGSATNETMINAPPNEDENTFIRSPILCGAKKKKGGTCGATKGWGTNHVGYGNCKNHGGATRNHVKAAQRARMVDEMRTYGIPIDTTPEQALLDEINRCAGHVAWLQDKVQQLSDVDLVWGMDSAKSIMSAETPAELLELAQGRELYEAVMKAGASVWLRLYQEERKALVTACAIAIKNGLDERKVQLAERQGMQLAAVMREVLVRMGVPASELYRLPDALKGALAQVMRQQPATVAVEGSVVV